MLVDEKPMPTAGVRPPAHVRFSFIRMTTWLYVVGGAAVRPHGAASDGGGGGSQAVRPNPTTTPRMATIATESFERVMAGNPCTAGPPRRTKRTDWCIRASACPSPDVHPRTAALVERVGRPGG